MKNCFSSAADSWCIDVLLKFGLAAMLVLHLVHADTIVPKLSNIC